MGRKGRGSIWNREARRSMASAEGTWQRTSPKSRITARIGGSLAAGLTVSGATHPLPSRRDGSTERQIFPRQMQIILQYGDDQIVIFALRQSGNRDRADATCPGEKNREASAVRSVILRIEAGFFVQSGVSALMRQANGVGTALIALDDVAFAANPVPIVRSGSRHGVRK